MLRRFRELLPSSRTAAVLAVGAGQQGGELRDALGSGVDVLATDVEPQAPVDLYCDAHELPFGDQTFDGAIATAVLEHVVDPSRAVAEIRRVLRDGGVVYSEVPFMQQVHAGALDFTRFTLSGHRLLFRDFRELATGTVAGPATTLVWTLERLAGAAVPGRNGSKAARGVMRLLVFWLKYLDYVLPNSGEAADGASCTYFLGVKEAGFRRSDADVVAAYRGRPQESGS